MAHSVSWSVIRRSLVLATRHLLRPAVLALLMALLVPHGAPAQSIDTVVTWNRVLLTAIGTPGNNPPTVFATRPLAVVSAAVFDAANSFDRLYQPAFGIVDVPPGASRDAAVAQAAHDALVGGDAEPDRDLRRRPGDVAGRHSRAGGPRRRRGRRRGGQGLYRRADRRRLGATVPAARAAQPPGLLEADAAGQLSGDVHQLSRRDAASSCRMAATS